MTERTYSDEQVQEILRSAIERDSRTRALNSDDLVKIAEDLGISAQSVHEAVYELEQAKALHSELASLRKGRKHSLIRGWVAWAVVSSTFCGLSYATHPPWLNIAYWVGGIWGAVLLLRTLFVALPNEEKDRKSAQRKVDKERAARKLKQARHRARVERAERRHSSSVPRQGPEVLEQLDAIIEQGVRELLNAAARKIGVRTKTGNESTPHPADIPPKKPR